MVKKFMCIKHAEDCYALQESIRFVVSNIKSFVLLNNIYQCGKWHFSYALIS